MRVFETLKASNPNLKVQGFYTRKLARSHISFSNKLYEICADNNDDDDDFVGEIRQGSERVGFEVVTLDSRKAPLASTTISRHLSLFLFL